MKTLICIPCMDMVHTAFLQSLLGLKLVGECGYSLRCSSLIYDARNSLVKEAIERGFDRMLWFDSDMTFNKDTMERLSARVDDGAEIVSGIYFKRKAPIKPVVYKDIGYYKDGNNYTPAAIGYDDYPKDSYFECKGFGFGCVMHTVDLAKRVVEKYGLPFSPVMGFGEDLSFCGRLTEIGVKMMCDSSIKCGHISQGVVTEKDYERGMTGA